MNKGFGAVELLVISVILALGVGIFMQRKSISDDEKTRNNAKATLSVLQGTLETYKITNETAHYPRSMRVNALATLVDKENAQHHVRFLDTPDSLYVSDGMGYTLVVASKTKKKMYYWSFHSTRTVFEGKEKPVL